MSDTVFSCRIFYAHRLSNSTLTPGTSTARPASNRAFACRSFIELANNIPSIAGASAWMPLPSNVHRDSRRTRRDVIPTGSTYLYSPNTGPSFRQFRQWGPCAFNQGGTDARQVADLRRTKSRRRGVCR